MAVDGSNSVQTQRHDAVHELPDAAQELVGFLGALRQHPLEVEAVGEKLALSCKGEDKVRHMSRRQRPSVRTHNLQNVECE